MVAWNLVQYVGTEKVGWFFFFASFNPFLIKIKIQVYFFKWLKIIKCKIPANMRTLTIQYVSPMDRKQINKEIMIMSIILPDFPYILFFITSVKIETTVKIGQVLGT